MKSSCVGNPPPEIEDLGNGTSFFNFNIEELEPLESGTLQFVYNQVLIINPVNEAKIDAALEKFYQAAGIPRYNTYIWPVIPKEITDAAGQNQLIVGIHAKIASSIQFDPEVNRDYPVSILFIQEDGRVFQEMLTSVEKMVAKRVEYGLDETLARSLIRSVLKRLSFPDDETDLLAAAELFATTYGYTLTE